jgi:hypothetical protein
MSKQSSTVRMDALEAQFSAVAVALRDGDVSQLESLSTRLQQMTVEFAHELAEQPQVANMSFTQLRRARALAQGFVTLRESLLRRQAVVEQALQVVIPATQAPTYAPMGSPYGAGPKSSGRFQGVAA